MLRGLIGHHTAPQRAIKPLLRVIQHSIYCVPPFIQAAAIAALQLPQSVVDSYVSQFRRRRDRAAATLDGLNGIRCAAPPATFYLFPSVGADDRAVAEEWLDKLTIAAVPGSAFGAAGAGYLRLSLACSDGDLNAALDKLQKHYGAKREARVG